MVGLEKQRYLILRLAQCRFLPGSFEKRIVRQWAMNWLNKPLSPEGEAYLATIAHRYRKQLSRIPSAL